ncbi:MAG TPA: DUF3516 domain-containing protein, partial [Verrucomicrobia bacterium]|nr:DUF3516 domain-containing protein [Verrucomicrobiota bacterium]
MAQSRTYQYLCKASGGNSETILTHFLDYIATTGLELYPAQEEALLELYDEKNVILNTPTGSGKSLVAAALHFKSVCEGKRSVYTCPIKALVNEKFLSLCREFGADQVGMVTGDATVNRKAPILCCTAEILSNIALHEGADAEFDDVIIDEFHYYSDRDRGVAWQTPLLTMSRSRFLLMSATLGKTDFFKDQLTQLNGKETTVVKSVNRPVPLTYKYYEIPLERTIEELTTEGNVPVYIVHPSQREAAETAQNLTSINFCTKEEKQQIAESLRGVRFTSPYGNDIRKYLRHGLGLHHAGLLPKYRVLVEQLAQKGFLKVICGTDTLGVGVNVPIRTVIFKKLCRFNGEKTVLYNSRDFHQISGRAGRKGFDDIGYVISMAPEHEIENKKLLEKAAKDPKKKKKLVKKKPPERGFIAWNQATFDRMIKSEPEALVSRFKVSHGMLLNVLSRRSSDGCRAMRKLIADCHESEESKSKLRKKAFQLFRSLVDRKIIEFDNNQETGPNKLRVNIDLQEDFSLNQSLSLYLLDTLPLLDPESENYCLDLLTLVESILENPEVILMRQLDKIKTRRMAEMKAEGIEFDKRIEELEKLEYPKPNREFIYTTFNQFAKEHPWVGQENIRPKSIAREMYENFQPFSDYIRGYSLQRVEGLLLRHLSSVYKVLIQTVPPSIKSEPINTMILFFGELLKKVDSSLVDEWERIRDQDRGITPEDEVKESAEPGIESILEAPDITHNQKAFEILIRNEVFRIARALAFDQFQEVIDLLEIDSKKTDTLTEEDLKSMADLFYEDHESIRIDPDARNPKNTT